MTATPLRVMTVCTGNICRSPMAEIVLRDRLDAAGLGDRVVVDSSGISDEEHGNPVDPRARRVLAAHGYPVGDGHGARQVTPHDVATHDLLLPMTAQHARRLRRLVGDGAGATAHGPFAEIRMYRSFDPAAPVVGHGQGVGGAGDEHLLDVDDPWYGDQDGFETCLAEIEAAADGVVRHVRTRLAEREAVAVD